MKKKINLTKKEAEIIINMLDDYESDMWGGMSKEDNKAYKKMRDCLCEMRTGRKYERNNL